MILSWHFTHSFIKCTEYLYFVCGRVRLWEGSMSFSWFQLHRWRFCNYSCNFPIGTFLKCLYSCSRKPVFYRDQCLILKANRILPRLVWLSGLSDSLQTKESLVRFPVRAHAWVAGQAHSRECARDDHTLMFLSLSPSLPLSLKINK